MTAVVEIGGGEFTFCAAHTGLHTDGFEPLHGHTYQLTVRLSGDVDPAGMVVDFGPVKAALRALIAPLRRRTLVAAHAGEVVVDPEAGRVSFGVGAKRYVLPAGDVAVLPVANTTTEQLARYLLDHLVEQLPDRRELARVQLRLQEAPDVAVVVDRTLR